MGKKEQERFSKEGTVFRNGKLVKADKEGNPVTCAFPPCQNYVLPNSKLGLCPTCNYVINLVAWFDQKATQEEQQKEEGPTILVPRPGMEDKAIAEALKKAKAAGAKGIAVIGNKEG